MTKRQTVQLLLNEDKRDHGQVIGGLLKRSERLECMVAFAKVSAFKGVMKDLPAGLARGLKARFAIGLNFYLTEPALLQKLMELDRKHALELYLGTSSETFHPKIYAFQQAKGCSVLIGSANLTAGGLQNNYEASALIEDAGGTLMGAISQHFDELITDEILVRATRPLIDDYARQYAIHDASRKVAEKRATKVSRVAGTSIEVLRDILALMKSDISEDGFESHRFRRKANRRRARLKLEELAATPAASRKHFLSRYEELLAVFHSGGLVRNKSAIANHADEFRSAIAAIMKSPRPRPREAYDLLLTHFAEIKGTGVNLLTEILHALDNRSFAVMNQNSVSGMVLAGIREYPLHPIKQNVDADCYARYCQQANSVREALGLADFTELDALFNYAYWRNADAEENALRPPLPAS